MVSSQDNEVNYNLICGNIAYDFNCGFLTIGMLNRVSVNSYLCYDWSYGQEYVFCSDCEDGTLNQQCSSTKPLYCSEGTLINDCQQCGCPDGRVCGGNGNCVL